MSLLCRLGLHRVALGGELLVPKGEGTYWSYVHFQCDRCHRWSPWVPGSAAFHPKVANWEKRP